MKHAQGNAASSVAKEVVKGSIVSSTVHTGSRLMSNVAKHPVLVFGLGLAAGYLVYKYRKQIISGTTRVVDAGKDFVLQQKENLEDIVAESRE
jgi:hypothetical protein